MVVLMIILLYVAFNGVNFKEVLVLMSNASVPWIFVFAFIILFAHYLRALRWKVILHSVKPDASIKNLYGALLIGYGVNNVIPRLGEFYRAVKLAKWEKLSTSSMFGTVILERVIDMLFFGTAVMVSGFVYDGDLYKKFPWLKTSLYIGSGLMFFLIVFLIIVISFREKFYKLITKFVGKFSVKLSEKINYIFEMLLCGFASLKGIKNYVYVFCLSMLIMLTYALNSYIGFFVLRMEEIPTIGATINYGMAWVTMSISSIGVMIPTPGGIGSFHAITKSILVSLYDFDKDVSAAYATLSHAISYVVTILTAALVYFILTKQNETGKNLDEGKNEELK